MWGWYLSADRRGKERGNAEAASFTTSPCISLQAILPERSEKALHFSSSFAGTSLVPANLTAGGENGRGFSPERIILRLACPFELSKCDSRRRVGLYLTSNPNSNLSSWEGWLLSLGTSPLAFSSYTPWGQVRPDLLGVV